MSDLDDMKKFIQSEFDKRRGTSGIQLEILGETANGSDDWVELVVRSSRDGVHAHQYAEVLADVEKAVKQRFHRTVVLVPAA